jgi:membrane-associated phospholipid phosphatase
MNPRQLIARLLPRGPLDLVIQFAIMAIAYWLWRHARGAVDGSMSESFAHARDLVAAERAIGSLIEPNLQHWAVNAGWPGEFVRWMYANAHFKGGCLALGAIYFLWRDSFGFVRNMAIAAMTISIAGYALFPTAPPRFLPELGLDGTSAVTGNNPYLSMPGDQLFNPFAAVPSMHVALAMIFAWSLALLVRNRWLKALLFAYPLLITLVVMATGNHFWLDAVFGAATAAAAAGIAMLLARLRPDWSFGSDRESVSVPAPEPEVEAAPA